MPIAEQNAGWFGAEKRLWPRVDLDLIATDAVVPGGICGRFRIPALSQLSCNLSWLDGFPGGKRVGSGVDADRISERALTQSRVHCPRKLCPRQNAGIPTMTRQRPKTTVLGLFIHLRNRSSLELPACMAVCCISLPDLSNELEVLSVRFTEPAQT